MIDLYFLLAITVIALFTPKGEHQLVNRILCVKFCIFIGLYYAMVSLGMTAGIHEDIIRSGLDLFFFGLFFKIRSYFLSFLCFNMAAFHVLNIFIPFNYFLVMVGFQIIQLMVAAGGMIDGLSYPRSRYNTNDSHHTGH